MKGGREFARRLLSGSRYVVIFAVIGALFASFATMIYGVLLTFKVITDQLFKESVSTYGAKKTAIGLVEVIDLYLIGTILYIFALGIYELFIDPELPMPKWLQIKSIAQLKSQLIGVLVVMIAVTFVGDAVEWDNSSAILQYGLACGSVILALSIFQWISAKKEVHAAEGD